MPHKYHTHTHTTASCMTKLPVPCVCAPGGLFQPDSFSLELRFRPAAWLPAPAPAPELGPGLQPFTRPQPPGGQAADGLLSPEQIVSGMCDAEAGRLYTAHRQRALQLGTREWGAEVATAGVVTDCGHGRGVDEHDQVDDQHGLSSNKMA